MPNVPHFMNLNMFYEWCLTVRVETKENEKVNLAKIFSTNNKIKAQPLICVGQKFYI